ncbi:unnamed protein product [Cylicostephanus goldi]|uniref:Uncharacterized protein n=1 Tax=Cylicostephanus goldi TaxID=71465 RepID=A0A3P6SEK5_CYLGO|nr:unnamed protein product [Cylicostephanus goldi]
MSAMEISAILPDAPIATTSSHGTTSMRRMRSSSR